jgi:hypothetical protein
MTKLISIAIGIVILLLTTAGYTGPQRPDGILCNKLDRDIPYTLGHQAKGGWFYSFDRNFTSAINLPSNSQISMYDADSLTIVTLTQGMIQRSLIFSTGNEAWSDWAQVDLSGEMTITVQVPDVRPSSNLCFATSIPVDTTPVPTEYVEATPIPEVFSTPTTITSTFMPSTRITITVAAPPVIRLPESTWVGVPTSLDDENEFAIYQTYLSRIIR